MSLHLYFISTAYSSTELSGLELSNEITEDANSWLLKLKIKLFSVRGIEGEILK